MGADSTRRPRDARSLSADPAGDPRAASDAGGETLAEKIRRYRQPAARPGDEAGSVGPVVRHPGQE